MTNRCKFCGSEDLMQTSQDLVCKKCQKFQRSSWGHSINKVLRRSSRFGEPFPNKGSKFRDFITPKVKDLIEFERRKKNPETEEKIKHESENSKRYKKPVITITHVKNDRMKIKVICPKCSNINMINKKKEKIPRKYYFRRFCSNCRFKLNFSVFS